MSTKRRGNERDADNDATSVDLRPHARPQNVIPFTKPRAIAALAASDPTAVAISKNGADPLAHLRPPLTMQGSATKLAAPQPAGLDRALKELADPTSIRPQGHTPAPASNAQVVQTASRSAVKSAQSSNTGAGHAGQPHAPTSQGHASHAQVSHAHAQGPHAQGQGSHARAQPRAAVPVPSHAGRAPALAAHRPAQVVPLHPAQAPQQPMTQGSLALAQPVTAWPVVQPEPAPVSPPPPAARPDATVPDFHHEAPTTWSPPPVMEPPLAAPKDRWAIFEKLGLGRPKIDPQAASKWLVNAYRLLGFAILTIIVVVLVGYIVSTAFFYMSTSWAVPMQVSSSDEKVVSLQAQVGEQQNARDKIADELNQAERAIVAQQEFQAEFTKAIKSDLDGRRAALARIKALANSAGATRAAIASQNRAYAGAQKKRMQQEYAAGLIDRDSMLNGKYQLAQISGSNLSLQEKQAEYETRAAELEATARSLDAILENAQTSGDTALSYEVLQIKQQYEASRLELAKAVETRDTLKASLARQDALLAALQGSAYLRAIHDKATVAFLPYGNTDRAKAGAPVYACKLTMVFCYHVGEVIELLPGEVAGRHPHRDKSLRGQFVEIKLDEDDADAGQTDVLFVGGKPFLL